MVLLKMSYPRSWHLKGKRPPGMLGDRFEKHPLPTVVKHVTPPVGPKDSSYFLHNVRTVCEPFAM